MRELGERGSREEQSWLWHQGPRELLPSSSRLSLPSPFRPSSSRPNGPAKQDRSLVVSTW